VNEVEYVLRKASPQRHGEHRGFKYGGCQKMNRQVAKDAKKKEERQDLMNCPPQSPRFERKK